MKPIIFSGTTEGRQMSERLSEAGTAHIVCVATAYGELVMKKSPYADIRQGRLTSEEMEGLISAEADTVFDATHPYAAEVSANIRSACEKTGRPYVRIIREGASAAGADMRVFEDAAACAEALSETEGSILLTTGSKELGIYAGDPEVRSRLFARVLPSEESIRLCADAGISGRQVIAMQGPFSKEMDLAVIRQYDIRIMVTKAGGRAGGFAEKIEAAAEAGVKLFVTGRPEEPAGGISAAEALQKYFGLPRRIRIDLVGTGPGSESLLTKEASDAIKNAEIICGAERMLKPYSGREAYPYYLAKDILPLIEERKPESIAVLFSGDTGFYSGAEKMRAALSEKLGESGFEYEIKVHPGISSFAYLAAKAGVPYQDAALCSMHGRSDDEQNLRVILEKIRRSRYCFVLMSGPEDVKKLGLGLKDAGLDDCVIILGKDLSYPGGRTGELKPVETVLIAEKGLYTALVINERPEAGHITKAIGDDEFIRGKVPMTKENIRHLSVLKLGLTEDAVVYDIGSGTGSVACEIAMQSRAVKVYAIEMKDEACSLIKQNAEKFGLANIEIVPGMAPEVFAGLSAPTHAFIGGSSGELRSILSALKEKADGIRIVINAVSLETMAEIQSVLSDYEISGLSIEQISVSRSRELGSYHLMTAENPVMIAAFTLGGRP